MKVGRLFLGLLSAAIAAAVLISSCRPGGRLTKANVDLVTEGMTKKQVESILGPPTSIDTTDLILLKTTTYTYKQSKETVTVVFKDDKVAEKESTLPE